MNEWKEKNENHLNIEIYIYNHGIIKIKEVIIDNEYRKIGYAFADYNGDIKIREFTVI